MKCGSAAAVFLRGSRAPFAILARGPLALVIGLALSVPARLAPVEGPAISIAPNQTVYLPGDTLRLLVSLSNPGAPSRADVFVGLDLPGGEIRFVDPTLRLVPAARERPATFVPFLADAALRSGVVFPAPGDLSVDTNGDGVPDAAPLSLPTKACRRVPTAPSPRWRSPGARPRAIPACWPV